MDLSRIEILLERYWNAVTTVEEEDELRSFFTSHDVPDEMKDAAALFKYFEMQKNASLNEEFDKAVINKLDKLPKAKGKLISLNSKNLVQLAAVISGILIASIIFKLEFWEAEQSKIMLVEDTFKTPEEAYEETKKAFMLIAEKMNSGRTQTQKITALNQAENKIKKEEK